MSELKSPFKHNGGIKPAFHEFLHCAVQHNQMLPFHNQIVVAFNQSKGNKAAGKCQVWKLLFYFSFYVSLVSTSTPFYLHTEHRNMPLDDAMRLVGQNFDQYMQDLRERAKVSGTQDSNKDTPAAVPKDEKTAEISNLLSKAATGADLSAEQLTKLIDSLSKRQEEILGSSTTANGKGGKNARHDFFPAPAVEKILTSLSQQLPTACFI